MKKELVNKSEIKLVGLTARTNNKNGKTGSENGVRPDNLTFRKSVCQA
jgi:hypothetical protein